MKLILVCSVIGLGICANPLNARDLWSINAVRPDPVVLPEGHDLAFASVFIGVLAEPTLYINFRYAPGQELWYASLTSEDLHTYLGTIPCYYYGGKVLLDSNVRIIVSRGTMPNVPKVASAEYTGAYCAPYVADAVQTVEGWRTKVEAENAPNEQRKEDREKLKNSILGTIGKMEADFGRRMLYPPCTVSYNGC